MNITFYGHACFGVEIDGVNLLFDPFISPNPLASQIDIDAIPADFILLSHGHEDHVADVEVIAKRTGATLVGAFEVVSWFGAKGIEKFHPMNIGGSWNFDFGTVKCVNAIHTSSMPDGSYGGAPLGFIVKTSAGNFYYSGDTALTLDMQLLADDELEFAMLCMGDNFTMGIEDAVKAASLIECDEIIGMHFDTFGYIKIDHDQAKSAFSSAGKNLKLPSIGETFTMP
ncbi:metal-dependent hydrolase [Pontibacter sp. G13]|uniref:metal-dependent hydrolase n=1 Tax=Pontibacter sp. G13 TaxID=3074898 RepID=UPI0028891271|nr:metal-dependent hydrolase [Pontibacter sp. G13]WNJ18974.1 metal-dependent hydrolase [Pontibacter sp. G13]